jgi:LPXTG-site transpeptidase (sortase) family protein
MKKGFTIVLILLLVALVSLRLYRFYEEQSHQQEREKLEQLYNEALEGEVPSSPAVVEQVFGKIMIASLDIQYIILNKTTDENLDISITKVTGPAIHQKGNLVLAGHNMKNGSFFGKLTNINMSDKIILEDQTGKKMEYVMIDKYIVDESDLSPLRQDDQTERMLTLITCTDNPDQRLIVVGHATIQ